MRFERREHSRARPSATASQPKALWGQPESRDGFTGGSGRLQRWVARMRVARIDSGAQARVRRYADATLTGEATTKRSASLCQCGDVNNDGSTTLASVPTKRWGRHDSGGRTSTRRFRHLNTTADDETAEARSTIWGRGSAGDVNGDGYERCGRRSIHRRHWRTAYVYMGGPVHSTDQLTGFSSHAPSDARRAVAAQTKRSVRTSSQPYLFARRRAESVGPQGSGLGRGRRC